MNKNLDLNCIFPDYSNLLGPNKDRILKIDGSIDGIKIAKEVN